MNCRKCGEEVSLPFTCPYCGDKLCSEHRLPENHACPRMDLAKTPKPEGPVSVTHGRTYTYETRMMRREPVQPGRPVYFSNLEARHLAIAALLVLFVGLSFEFPWVLAEATQALFLSDYVTLMIFTVILMSSFFLHEIAHKAAARREGLWAEFRLVLNGVILTLISIVSPFKIVSPGAVMVVGGAGREAMGRISIAGPLTNIGLSVLMLMLAFHVPSNTLRLGSMLNAWIALFNLLPFGMMDGLKVFLWNKTSWLSAFTAALVLTIASFIILV